MPHVVLLISLFFSVLGVAVRSEAPTQTFFPASIPLANRSPYLSAWYSSTNGSAPLSHSWPVFWNQQDHLGWSGKIRVDGVSYEWMSDNLSPPFTANVTNVQITPTRSVFVMQAGPMNVTVTFLSPIEPSDWVLQSLPFSYVSLQASALDGQTHEVHVYSDITAEWLSGNRNSPVAWSHNTSGSTRFHEIRLQSPQEGVEEVNQQAQDGIAYYAMANRPGISWQIDQDRFSRGIFDSQGVLANNVSTAFAPIAPIWTVFAFAMDLGQIQSTQEPVTWAVGYVRNPSITYTTPDFTVHELSPYFVTKYGTDVGAAIDYFVSGYDDALQRAIQFDEKVTAPAAAVSSQYVDLVSLAARQVLSTLDITISTGSDGQPNASDVRIFMKDIGEAGSSPGRVNPVERMYAALPALLYVNASLVGPMLRPLLEAQDSTDATPYATQDIGLAYPNATGAHGPHRQGIEQSGNMLIMLYAHARYSGDGSLLRSYYDLAKRWAEYLVDNTLVPTNQLSADNEGIANMTNLAIKGIIGVKAMARISLALGEDLDAQHYDSHAATLAGQWQSLALSSDHQHILGVYGDETSWALMYNLYADRLLNTSVVSNTLLQTQTAFYKILLSTAPAFGLKLDNTVSGTSTAWLLFTAATVLDNDVRDSLVHGAWSRASSNLTMGPFPDQYDVDTGAVLDGSAGPAVGGVFSLLALSLPPKDIVVSQEDQPQGPDADAHRARVTAGVIAGGVIGCAALVALVAVGVFLVCRRRRAGSQQNELPHSALWIYGLPPRPHDKRTSPCGAMAERPSNLRTSKAREASPHMHPAWPAPPDGHPNTGGISGTEPVARGGLRSVGLDPPIEDSPSSRPDVLTLRMELENLRRVVEGIQDERMAPPPEYVG